MFVSFVETCIFKTFHREPSYEMNCVTMQKEDGIGQWNWVTRNCSDTRDTYTVCEYPYYPSNFTIENDEGNA